MFRKCIQYLLVFTITLKYCDSAKILVYCNTPSYSHQNSFRPLWTALAKRGHKITLFTTDPMPNPNENITQVDLHGSYQFIEKHNVFEIMSAPDSSLWTMIKMVRDSFYEIMDYQFSRPEIQTVKNERFDLIISEYIFYPSKKFDTPFIGIMSMDGHYMAHDAIGNPSHPVINPDIDLPYISPYMTFKERLYSTLFSVIFRLATKYYWFPDQDEIVRKYVSPDLPKLEDIAKNMSMLFVKANPIFYSTRALVPACINICDEPVYLDEKKPMPKEFQEFMDGAKHGVIYFSLGTNVRTHTLSKSTLNIMLEVFSELPYKVLWKFNPEAFSEVPSNVNITKWAPQKDLLRHPNMKLFITQGGLQSLEETVYSEVPILGMPFFGDQFGNVKRMAYTGIGLSVDHINLDKETFKGSIMEVIQNPKYKKKITQLKNQVSDQPMTGLEKAVWWTEYVIRHKGARHLRSPVLDVPLYQYILLDVLGFIFTLIGIFIFVIYKSTKLVCYLIRRNKVSGTKKKQ